MSHGWKYGWSISHSRQDIWCLFPLIYILIYLYLYRYCNIHIHLRLIIPCYCFCKLLINATLWSANMLGWIFRHVHEYRYVYIHIDCKYRYTMVYHKEAEFHNDLTTSSTACDDYQFLSLSLYIYLYIHMYVLFIARRNAKKPMFSPQGQKTTGLQASAYMYWYLYT